MVMCDLRSTVAVADPDRASQAGKTLPRTAFFAVGSVRKTMVRINSLVWVDRLGRAYGNAWRFVATVAGKVGKGAPLLGHPLIDGNNQAVGKPKAPLRVNRKTQ